VKQINQLDQVKIQLRHQQAISNKMNMIHSNAAKWLCTGWTVAV
jgi:hypothetical protein